MSRQNINVISGICSLVCTLMTVTIRSQVKIIWIYLSHEFLPSNFSLQLATIHPTLNIFLLFFGKKRGIQQNSVLFFMYVYHNFLSFWWRLAKCNMLTVTSLPAHKQCCTTTHEIDTVGKKKIRAREKKPGKVDNKNSMSKCVIIGLL